MEKYLVLDSYDLDLEPEILAYCNTLQNVKKAIKKRVDETDGECYIQVFKCINDCYEEIDYKF